ncbi:hypothetical protein [Massilia phyllosphaerae]|uniref:hypothetical protein n=1 Tax=Massilia phyllosphaerae TaxID=3106034 RepID=UPI002B1CCC7A|nr:hypothetical protein [Massilia sp. SGZ-792]
MTAMIATAFPSSRGAAYKACELIINQGPKTVEQLLVAVDFGAHGTQQAKITAAIQAGWLHETPAGTIDVTESVREHFAGLAPKEKYAGQITPPQYRPDIFRSQGLSKRYIPNSRGTRADVPAWSVRETVKIVTIKRSEP